MVAEQRRDLVTQAVVVSAELLTGLPILEHVLAEEAKLLRDGLVLQV